MKDSINLANKISEAHIPIDKLKAVSELVYQSSEGDIDANFDSDRFIGLGMILTDIAGEMKQIVDEAHEICDQMRSNGKGGD